MSIIWTQSEDQNLLQLYSLHPEEWKLIAQKLEKPNHHICLLRYKQLKRLTELSAFRKWTIQEDELMKELLEIYSYEWDIISTYLRDRNPTDCYIRFVYLNARKSNQNAFTQRKEGVNQRQIQMTQPDAIQEQNNESQDHSQEENNSYRIQEQGTEQKSSAEESYQYSSQQEQGKQQIGQDSQSLVDEIVIVPTTSRKRLIKRKKTKRKRRINQANKNSNMDVQQRNSDVSVQKSYDGQDKYTQWTEMEDMFLLTFYYLYPQDWSLISSKLKKKRSACKYRYRKLKNLLKGPNSKSWKKDELQKLQEIAPEYFYEWDKICRQLYRCNSVSCYNAFAKLKRHQRSRKHQQLTQFQILNEPEWTQNEPEWTQNEDICLKKLYASHPQDWGKISNQFIMKNQTDCKNRYILVNQLSTTDDAQQQYEWNNLTDLTLMSLASEKRYEWGEISQYFSIPKSICYARFVRLFEQNLLKIQYIENTIEEQ